MTLIGRDAEVSRLMAHLNSPTAAPTRLLVVTGAAGSGKSALVKHLGGLASDRGWRVHPRDDISDLVTPTTTVDVFSSAVRRALGIQAAIVGDPCDGSVKVAVPRAVCHDGPDRRDRLAGVSPLIALAGTSAPERTLDALDVVPIITRVLGFDGTKLVELLKRFREASVATGTESLLDPLAMQLGAQLPTVLCIDNFRPSPEFAEWIAQQFVPDLRRVMAPVVLILAHGPSGLPAVDAAADDVVTLGQLERHAVLSHFSSILVKPPLDSAELDAYVETVRQRPDLLWSLTHVLKLLAVGVLG